MGYQYPPQRPRKQSQIAGIVILMAFLIVSAIFILISFTALGAIFSKFDVMTNMLTTPALNVYDFLRSTVVNVFSLLAIIIMLSVLGAIISAIFALNQSGTNE